jgi:hypothetical protein
MLQAIGVARKRADMTVMNPVEPGRPVREFGFLRVEDLIPSYRAFLQPILDDKGLGDNNELGVLMCSWPTVRGPDGTRVPWTVFVKPTWLRRVADGRARETDPNGEIPAKIILGRVPGWPDEFLEFLAAIVQTGSVFRWRRTSQGHLALEQYR